MGGTGGHGVRVWVGRRTWGKGVGGAGGHEVRVWVGQEDMR